MKNFFRLFFFIFILFSLVSCHKQEEEETTTSVDEIIQIHDDVLSLLNDQCQNGKDVETALNNCIEHIQSYSNVSSAYLQNNQLIINYQSGMNSFILFLPEEDNSPNNKVSPHKKNNFNTINKSRNKTDESNVITNHNVLFWCPFYNDWHNTADELEDVFNYMNNHSNSNLNFSVDILTETDCDINSLLDITNYGYVFIETHGFAYTKSGKNFVALCTGEKVQKGQKITANSGKIVFRMITYDLGLPNNTRITFQGNSDYYGVTNDYFSNSISSKFDTASVVILTACQGMANSSLSDVFVNNLNAGALIGYDDYVTKEFGWEKAIEFTENMLLDKKNAFDAYQSIGIKTDPYWTPYNELVFDSWLPVFIPHHCANLLYAGLSAQSAPTYFEKEDDGSLGHLICNDGRTYQLHSCHYSPGGSLTFLHSNADGEPSYVMAFFSLTMCNTALGNLHPLQPSSTDEWMNLNSNDPWGFWVKSSCTDVSSRLSIAGSGSIKMTDGGVTYNSSAGFSFWFMDEDGHRWDGTYNGPVS